MDWRVLATVAHLLAAFWFVAGYVGTNALTESHASPGCSGARLPRTAPAASLWMWRSSGAVQVMAASPSSLAPRPLSVGAALGNEIRRQFACKPARYPQLWRTRVKPWKGLRAAELV